MRVATGPVRHDLDDGSTIWLDHQLGPEQLDVLLAACAAAGQTPASVIEVDITEGRTVVRWFWQPRSGLPEIRMTIIEPAR